MARLAVLEDEPQVLVLAVSCPMPNTRQRRRPMLLKPWRSFAPTSTSTSCSPISISARTVQMASALRSEASRRAQIASR